MQHPVTSEIEQPVRETVRSKTALSLSTCNHWWACLDSNQEPDRYERAARRYDSRHVQYSLIGNAPLHFSVRSTTTGWVAANGGAID